MQELDNLLKNEAEEDADFEIASLIREELDRNNPTITRL